MKIRAIITFISLTTITAAMMLSSATEAQAQHYRWNNSQSSTVRNFSACETYRTQYNTYVSFYNNATTQQERDSYRRMLDEARRKMNAAGC